MKRSEVIARLREIIYLLEHGCSDNSCQNPNKERGGMGTNASCRCQPVHIANQIEDLFFDLGADRISKWNKEDATQKEEV